MENTQKDKKITLRDRKKAQPKAVIYFSEAEKETIKRTVAMTLDAPQTNIFFYTAQALGLNPLLNEIAAITYKTKQPDGTYEKKMSIQVMRDGFLTIAHRSGKFAGLESGINMSEDGTTIINGWAKVYHKDFKFPVYQEADFSEYTTDRNPLWKSKPKTMIKKVAESMALRKAFNVNGVYAPEEMEKEIISEAVAPKVLELADGGKPATEEQLATIKSLGGLKRFTDDKTGDNKLTKQEAAEYINELSTKK